MKRKFKTGDLVLWLGSTTSASQNNAGIILSVKEVHYDFFNSTHDVYSVYWLDTGATSEAFEGALTGVELE